MDLLKIDLPNEPAPAGEILEQNLRALAGTSPVAAEKIRAALPRLGAQLIETQEDALGLVVDGATVASRRRPLTEAARFADSVDLTQAATVCVIGFGAGHHCQELCQRMKGQGVVLCYEPDVELLRLVLERVDLTEWLAASRFVLITDADDRASISLGLAGMEGVIAMGVKVVEHPGSRARLKETSGQFADAFTEVLGATKTQISTTLLQSTRTLRNLLMNLDRYAGADGIHELLDVCPGRPAVLVAAGPSLTSNLDQLADPALRDRVVIIAVQTVLKPMLARGIKPHFVTALDFHEISTRFYEGLSPADVEGVTLVADPKVNPAVLSAWPGKRRLIANDLLDGILAPGSAVPKGELKPGATVAHLSHYLARAMGCDPVILIGQDLAFTDGVYYGPCAAIHDVWAPEIGPFRSVEQLEWERVARHKNSLRPATDINGRPIFTDAQMASYLAQFEVDFAEDQANGLTVIDATEGGVRKNRTLAMTLAQALEQHAQHTHPSLPAAAVHSDGANRALARVRVVHAQAQRLSQQCRASAELLSEMIDHQHDQSRVNRLITKVNAVRDEVLATEPGWQLVDFINQAGTLHRIKADRKIEMDAPADPLAKQRAQLERDLKNVNGLADAADHLAGMLAQARAMLDGSGPRLTRDTAVEPETNHSIEINSRPRVEALIPVDPDFGGLGTPRDLAAPVWRDANALRLTVGRLLLADQLDGITLLTPEPSRVAHLLGGLASNPKLSIERIDEDRLRQRTAIIGKARLFGASSWRGGVAGLTCYDEAFDPATALEIMSRRSLSAAVIVGADWSLVDPELTNQVIARHREAPAQVPMAFTQAAPGLAGFLIDAGTAAKLAAAQPNGSTLATIGGLMGYIPSAPAGDPIATHACVGVPQIARDCARRAIADSEHGVRTVAAVINAIGSQWIEADAATIATELLQADRGGPVPQRLELEACTGRLSGAQLHEPRERIALDMPSAHRVLRELAMERSDAAVTLAGAGDPLSHPGAINLVQLATECGVGAVHLRTELLHDINPAELLDAGPAVISVDLHARTPETYRDITGVDRHAKVIERVQALLEEARSRGSCGLPSCWIVPRITRRDCTITQIPDWYDGMLAGAGVAIIDPAPRALPGDRVWPIAPPPGAIARLAIEELAVNSDLTINELAEPLSDSLSLPDAWKRVLRHRRSAIGTLEPKGTARVGVA